MTQYFVVQNMKDTS